MRAVQFADYGGPEVLRLGDVPVPEPGEHQVRVAVRVAGVNPFDWKLRSGEMAEMVNPTLPHTPGLELAGVVDAVGAGAESRIGDEVFGWAVTGSYAEYALARTVIRKPADLSFRDAAGLPVAGEAALRGLRLLDLHQGEVLLIHGASGTVGALATQIALARGITVIGTAGENNLDHVRSLGATAVHYGDKLIDRVHQTAPHGVHAVFDTAGKGALPDLVELRGGAERIVTIADGAAFDMGITFSAGSRGDRNTDVLRDLADQVVNGRLLLNNAESLPLAAAAEAHRDSESGHAGGKITLTVP